MQLCLYTLLYTFCKYLFSMNMFRLLAVVAADFNTGSDCSEAAVRICSSGGGVWVRLKVSQAKRGPTLQRFDCLLKERAPITWPAMPHQKLITTDKQTNIERGLEMKTKKSSCIFSNIYLFFPHNIRAYTSDSIPTRSVCLLIYTQGGGNFGHE